MLTVSQIEARAGKLTASRVACLMNGDRDAVLNLWKEMVGDTSYVEPDFSDNWAMQLGSATEPFHLDWIDRKHDLRLSKRGVVELYNDIPGHWAACTLDAWSDNNCCPVEAKHCGGFEKMDVIINRYAAQCHWAMLVTGTSRCILSVIMGAREPIIEHIPFDKDYAAELWRRAEAFMACVNSLTPPFPMPAVEPPVAPTAEIDMSSSNSWVAAAADWREHKIDAKKFDDAAKRLKELVPKDAKRVFGGNIEAKRDRGGKIKIGEL